MAAGAYRTTDRIRIVPLLLIPLLGCQGPATNRNPVGPLASTSSPPPGVHSMDFTRTEPERQNDGAPSDTDAAEASGAVRPVAAQLVSGEAPIEAWIAEAMGANPELQRLQAEARAAWERVPQVVALPDPMTGGTVYGEPMQMGDGELRGTFMVSQVIPSLKRLDALGQQAAFEALVLQQETEAARLRIAAEVEEAAWRLYLLGQLLRINEANQQLFESLVEVATSRVEVGGATPGDVVLGTLELGRVEEERLMLLQQIASRKALLNQLLNRPADSPITVPEEIEEGSAELSHEQLRSLAFQRQPEIVATRLQTQATVWGVRVARWQRVPDVTLSYEQMFMEMDPGHDGPDPWQVGVGVNLPIWRSKYSAIEREAQQQNFAARRGVEEAVRRYDAMLLDLLEQARAAERTARLYRETILPQSRQALEADQRAYAQGSVTFERVVGDAQNLLTAEAALHRALTEQAIAMARLRQATGGALPTPLEEVAVPPPLQSFLSD